MQSSAQAATLTKPTLNSPFKEHAAYAFDTVYRNPYPYREAKPEHRIARQIHGITHVTRAANYIYPLVNLYRHFGDHEADALTNDDIHLIKIAVLYHDAARQNEDRDFWDKESAEMLFNYLTKTLNVSIEKATLLAEAMANKDENEDDYYQLTLNNGTIQWTLSKEKRKKSIYQKLIHDADCLDIIRARPSFDANYLDFYKHIAHQNPVAFELMATLITEARSLIDQHGDSCLDLDFKLKSQYEHRDADTAIKKSIQQMPTSLLSTLHERLLTPTERNPFLYSLIPDQKTVEKKGPITEAIMQQKIRQGKVFARSIPLSSAIRKKESSTKDAKETKTDPDETIAHVEIRKMMRRLGTATRTKKPNRLLKNGNPNRSISMIGWGAAVYSDAGFLIVDPDITDISGVNKTDSDSGRLKKRQLNHQSHRDTPTETQAKLDALLRQQKMGGSSMSYTGSDKAAHNEVLYTVKQVDAVYFSYDYNLFDTCSSQTRQSKHRYSPVLQAIYLQNEYYQMTKQPLPIFEYSGTHNFIKERKYSPDEIIQMWETMCRDYIQQQLDAGKYDVLTLSVEQIKTVSMYQNATMDYIKHNAPADANYTDAMKQILNTRIKSIHEETIAKHQADLLRKLIAAPSILNSNALYQGILQYPTLTEHPSIKAKLLDEINRKLSDARYLKKALEEEYEFLLDSRALKKEDYALLLSDKNAFLSIEHIASSYHDTMINKLYTLAKNMKLDQHVQTLQKLAHKAILNQIKMADESFMYSYPLDKIIEISCLFDCYPDHKNFIMQSMEAYLAKLLAPSTERTSHDYLSDIANYADGLNEFHLMSEGIKKQLTEAAHRYGKWLMSEPSCKLSIDTYLKLATNAEIPLTLQTTVIKAYIENHKSLQYAVRYHDMTALLKSGILNDEHLFQLFISKIDFNPPSFSTYDTLHYYDEYCNNLRYLFNNQPLTRAQSACIEKTKQSLAYQYYTHLVEHLRNSRLSPHDMYMVIALGNAANVPSKDIKSDIIELLLDCEKCSSINEDNTGFLSLFERSSWLCDDAELFEQWIINFTTNNADAFIKQIDLFKNAMPMKSFSKMQSEIIDRYAVKQFGETTARRLRGPDDSTQNPYSLFAVKPAIKTEEATTAIDPPLKTVAATQQSPS